jgi:translation initiation factor IF-2
MSIRIHELAKKIGLENKELLSLLKDRNFDVKTASSTVDNISAEALIAEFAKPEVEAPPPPSVKPAVPTPVEDKPAGGPPRVVIPSGVFVKTKADLEREKEEQARAAAAAEAAKAALAPPPVAAPHPPATPSAPAPARPSSPPLPPPIGKAPPAPPRTSPPMPPRVNPVAMAPRPPLSVPPRAPVPASPAATPAPSTPPPMARPALAPPPRPTAGSPAATPPTPVTITLGATTSGEIRTIQVKPPIIVREFAAALELKPFKLISELMEMGIFASMNQTIEEAVAVQVAEKHHVILDIKHRGDAQQAQAKPTEKDIARAEEKAAEEEERNLETRPPVVCILGHVDHGKTSLLDTIRKANVVAGEAGGITQHIGAYQVEKNGKKITFLDTPGHAAFNKMRARGAQVTDIAILVVAADDGFMPQTDEALRFIKEAGVSLIVAINKIDTKGANIDQVKTHMQQRNIPAEDWGGETITVPVSAIKGTGIDDLLEMIQLQADVLELKANPKAKASGIVIESQLDAGRGSLATVIVQRGTLKVGDAIVCGPNWARVRAMFDDQGKNLKEAPPATPVRVIGWSGTPDSGATFTSAKNAREAENIAEEEAHRLKKVVSVAAAVPKEISVESLFANIAATQAKTLRVVIKSDVFGSAEAVRGILEGIKSSKVDLEVVSSEVGLVTKNDVLMASAADSVIVAFNTKLENGVTPLAKHHGVRIETFEIIYELVDRAKEMMADLLDPDLKEVKLGAAEVREVFPLAKGFVAGCLVTEGKITRNAMARLRRGKQSVHEGKIGTLKRFKDDANEVRAGLECGIKLDDFNGYEKGDVIEVFEVQKVRAAL